MRQVILNFQALSHRTIKGKEEFLDAFYKLSCHNYRSRSSLPQTQVVNILSDLLFLALRIDWLYHSYSKMESPGLETLILELSISYFDIIIQVFIGLFQTAVKGKSSSTASTIGQLVWGLVSRLLKIYPIFKKGSIGKMLHKNKEHIVIVNYIINYFKTKDMLIYFSFYFY